MSSQSDVYVSLEFTPNPNTLKYSVNRVLVEKGTVNFLKKADADQRSPMAARLFEVPGITAVMIGRNFVTVTKAEAGDWDVVHKSSSAIIEKHLNQNEPVVLASSEGPEAHQAGQTEIETKIREILDHEIRPAVAMDGGDITFEKFEDGIVYVYLQGSCSGCPSSTATLKLGIETRLRNAIPEVQEVVAV